jgi:hypothetical protein
MVIRQPLKWGLEEEVFVTEPEKPGTESLYYLAKLLRQNPRFFYLRTASNFARGRDIFQGLMSCVEVSTSVCEDIDELLEDLKLRRKELCGVCDGLIVPMGHLMNSDAPTNTAALQIHLSGMNDWEKTYANLVHFLPVLALISANAPAANRSYFGKSFRMARSFAVGPLSGNPYNRFQDIIFAKRLNTLEIRVFDPFWDLERMEILLKAINAIVNLDYDFTLDIEAYNRLRSHFVLYGMNEDTEKIYKELSGICDLPKEMVENTPGDEVWELFESNLDLTATYSALDNAYRNGELKAEARFKQKSFPIRLLRKIGGFGGYYLPKLPFIIYKYLKEK